MARNSIYRSALSTAKSHGVVNSTNFATRPAALHCDSLGLDLMEEAEALVPLAKHVHIHDSFGRTGNIPVHTQQEALGLGVGDLHLPIGWGNLPFDEIVCLDRFPKDAIFNIELNKHRWHAIEETVVAARRIAKLAFEQSRPD